MAFADNLKTILPVDRVEKLELLDDAGNVAATLENKPGKAGSLAVYHHLILTHRKIDRASAREGLALFAEHTEDARGNPGKHPNIDRLLEVIERNLTYTGRITAR